MAIVQSNYIPWKGYFDLINLVDEFILLDEVQYTRRDWRNRNLIKVETGAAWLTIPIAARGNFLQRICDTTVSESDWASEHWKSICHWYGKAPHFANYAAWAEELYLGCRERFLSQINYHFLSGICERLGISTRLSWSTDYESCGSKSSRLVSLCQSAGATEYLSGPTARAYLEEELFRRVGIRVRWMDYSDYPAYNQLYPPFIHAVSILDLVFCEGPRAQLYLKSF